MANSVNLDTIDEAVVSVNDDSRVALSDRADQETVRDTMNAALDPIRNHTTPVIPMDHTVTVGPVPTEMEVLQQKVDEVYPELMTALDNLDNGIEPDPNFVTRIQDLVARVLTLLNKMAEKNKAQLKQLEDEYRKATLNAADIQRGLGSHGLKVAAASFAVSLLGLVSFGRSEIAMQADKPFVDLTARDVIPGIGNMWKAPDESKMSELNSKAQLLLQKVQQQGNETQSETAKRQQAEELQNKASRMLEAATQAR